MLWTAILLCTGMVAGDQSLPRSILGKEQSYIDATGPEKEVEGKLDFNASEGRIGLPQRYATFRLIGLEDGKPVSRSVYTAGKDQLLAEFVGQRLRLSGKVVEFERDGKKQSEFWPAQVLAALGAATESIGQVPILARTNNPLSLSSRGQLQPRAYVIRDAAALAQLANYGGAEGARTATSQMARALGRGDIDWKKEMLLVMMGGLQPSGGARVEITRLVLLEQGLDVTWKLTTTAGGVGAGVVPVEVVLIPRYDGDIRVFREGSRQPILLPAENKTVPNQ
jgi:hypothetical protein